MKDISMKNCSLKYAKAQGELVLNKDVINLIKNNEIKAGNVIETAKNCGLIGGKLAANQLLHSHTSQIDYVNTEVQLTDDSLIVTSEVKAISKSGVESNAIFSVTNALVNAFDMTRCLCKNAKISNIEIVESTGKTKDFIRKRKEPVKAALLIVSDVKFSGSKKDNTSEIISEFLKKQQVNVQISKIMEEKEEDLKNEVNNLVKNGIQLILLAGSTSLNSKGVASKVSKEICERSLPGITESIRKYGRERTPYSMFSDEFCGVIKDTIILNIPGNSTGAIESLSAIFPGFLKAYSMMKKAKKLKNN